MRIRTATDDDLPALTTLYNHYIAHTPATFDLEPYSVERRRAEWFAKYAPRGRYRVLVAEDAEGRILGMTYSSVWRPKRAYETTVETSVYCDPAHTGRGIGGALYEALFRELANEDVVQAIALITLPNDPSVKLHERFGFRPAGVWRDVGRKFGRFWDVGVYQRGVSG